MNSSLSRKAVFILILLASSVCASHGGHHGGEHGEGYQSGRGNNHYHGGGRNYHGHRGERGYYHGGGGGYYHGHGGYYYGSPGIVIGVPLGGYYGPDYYYPQVCETVRICNPSGRCWLQRECD